MSFSERIHELEEQHRQAAAANLNGSPGIDRDAVESGLRFVSLREFLKIELPTAEPLLGTPEETIIAAGGDVVTYGTGGSGKTTMTVDGAVHMAGGAPWIGMPVPRPIAITMIENEGVAGKFQQKLDRRVAAWQGDEVRDRVHLLLEPWGKFSFANERHRHEIAEHLNQTATELLISGPVATLGMVGGGTPDEINAFMAYLDMLRELVDHPVAWWGVHHENRSGQVSGAWERVPSTLMHTKARGHGHNAIFWQKTRDSSLYHQTTTKLAWAAGWTYTVEASEEEMTAERVWEAIAEYILANGGTSWNPAHEAVSGNTDLKRSTRDAMIVDGVLKNMGFGKTFVLWHRDDPARPIDLSDEVRP
jgi:hypothetical protein